MATNPTTLSAISALNQYNKDHSTAWTFGTNWTNVNSGFETFINNYLFPKLNETTIVDVALGNRFESLAKEVDFISQFSEEYVILDSVPVSMNLSKDEVLMLKRNYPKMATKLYGPGALKKVKFTLNNNDTRHNFLTLMDATAYALAVYQRKVSDINVSEELEVKGTIIDYALNHAKDRREVATADEMLDTTFEAILNIQNNSSYYNEADKASGGKIGRHTTVSALDNVMILTNDKMKTHLLNSKLAQTFNAGGIDFSSRIISFDRLGGCYRLLKDVIISDPNTLAKFQAMGDYQVQMGDTIPKGVILTFDITGHTEFTALTVEEVKPPSDIFAYVFDINKVKYRRNTKGMLKLPFYNGEFDEVTYWMHYQSFKSVSPFFNSVLIGAELTPVVPEEEIVA